MIAYAHNYEEARKEAGPGKLPLLGFKGGGHHILLPTGQHVRKDRKDRSISGKTLRKEQRRHRLGLREARQLVEGVASQQAAQQAAGQENPA